MFLSQILIPVAIGMITGMLSGWLSGAMVTHHYRKLDERQEQHNLHIKYLEDSALHISKVLNEVDLQIHHDGPPDHENVLREIGIIQIPAGKLNREDDSSSIIQEKDRLLSEIEKGLKEDSIDLQYASLQLIRLSIRLMNAIEEYRQKNLRTP